MRVEVLSVIGEEAVDLRDFEHLLAATPDDAYNGLVATRFAAEFGRERVYQIAPDDSSGRYAASREWRGKIAVAADMVHQRLSDLMQGGAAFVVEPFRADAAPSGSDSGWRVALVGANGSLTMFSPEHEDTPGDGDLVVKLYQPTLAPELELSLPRRRRFALRARPKVT